MTTTNNINIGITGPRGGLSPAQRSFAMELMAKVVIDPTHQFTFHHGDCIGVDQQIHQLLLSWSITSIETHPPTKTRFRAFCGVYDDTTLVHLPAPYLERDRNIVKASNVVIGFPNCSQEEAPRSGTWYTVQHAMVQYAMAHNAGKVVLVVMPDGSLPSRYRVGDLPGYIPAPIPTED